MKLMFRNKQFYFFSEFEISLNYNAVASTFSFQAVNSILGQPLVYSWVQIFDDEDNLLITGYILSSGYKISNKPEYETYPGYSITGAIEDCSVPYPTQNDNLSLKQIATNLLKPFGISFVVDPTISDDMDKAYEKTTADDGQTIKEYLSDLASQRNIIISHNEKGQLVFTRLNVNRLKPVASFIEGEPGAENISLTANGQNMHSRITVVRQASAENADAGEYTINNPYVTNRYRPKVVKQNSGDIFDVKKAARMELGKELMNIEVIIETTKFIKPGSIVEVQSDRLKLRKKTNFFVTSTTIKGTKESIKYTLKCVLPDCFSDNTVMNIFT